MKIKTKRKLQLIVVPTLSGVLVGTLTTGAILLTNFMKYRSNEKELKDYFEAKSLVEEYFYGETDNSSFMSNALKGAIAGLNDPYANYMTPDEYGKAQQNISGTLTGIGVTVALNEEGKYVIMALNEDAPAIKADIQVGDIIVKAMGVDTTNMEFADLINLIQGKEGTEVTITLERDGKQLEKTLVRETIESETVECQMLENKTAYIKITAFKDITPKQYLEAMKEMVKQGAEGIVFDVRNNGGGSVDSCEKCLDPLLPEDDVAVAEFKDGSTTVICSSDADEIKMPMVVLVNENSASAAELFACALRDYGKAKLVGINTFGKGIMQNTIPLTNGGALKMTVAQYRTTKSECFHEVGLKPDYEVENPENTDISKPDVTKDRQLKKALEVLQEGN